MVGLIEGINMDKKESATLELVILVRENPKLPIIAVVDSDVVVNHDYDKWFGKVTKARIESMWTSTLNGVSHTWTIKEALMEKDIFIKENAPYDLIERLDKLNGVDFDIEANKWIKSLPWKKYIVVYVGVPNNMKG